MYLVFDWPIMLEFWKWSRKIEMLSVCVPVQVILLFSPLLSALEGLGLCDTKYCTFKPHPRVERVLWLSVVDIHCWVAWCNLRNAISSKPHPSFCCLHFCKSIGSLKSLIKKWSEVVESCFKVDWPSLFGCGRKMSWKWMHTTCQVYYVWVGE